MPKFKVGDKVKFTDFYTNTNPGNAGWKYRIDDIVRTGYYISGHRDTDGAVYPGNVHRFEDCNDWFMLDDPILQRINDVLLENGIKHTLT